MILFMLSYLCFFLIWSNKYFLYGFCLRCLIKTFPDPTLFKQSPMSLSIVLLKGNQSPGCVRDCLAISREEVRAREATSGGSCLGCSPDRLGHFAITFTSPSRVLMSPFIRFKSSFTFRVTLQLLPVCYLQRPVTCGTAPAFPEINPGSLSK